MLDLSYINEQPSEAQEQAIQEAITRECLKAISIYLEEVATAMEANNVEAIGTLTLRAMAKEFTDRIKNNEEN